MQNSTEQVTNEKPVNREALVAALETMRQTPEHAAKVFGPEGLTSVATDALQLLTEYDTVLRGLACWLSAGGWNSDGLIDPDVADKKIRWGVNYLMQDARAAPSVAAASSAD